MAAEGEKKSVAKNEQPTSPKPPQNHKTTHGLFAALRRNEKRVFAFQNDLGKLISSLILWF